MFPPLQNNNGLVIKDLLKGTASASFEADQAI
jgi:hypothetical protein